MAMHTSLAMYIALVVTTSDIQVEANAKTASFSATIVTTLLRLTASIAEISVAATIESSQVIPARDSTPSPQKAGVQVSVSSDTNRTRYLAVLLRDLSHCQARADLEISLPNHPGPEVFMSDSSCGNLSDSLHTLQIIPNGQWL